MSRVGTRNETICRIERTEFLGLRTIRLLRLRDWAEADRKLGMLQVNHDERKLGMPRAFFGFGCLFRYDLKNSCKKNGTQSIFDWLSKLTWKKIIKYV